MIAKSSSGHSFLLLAVLLLPAIALADADLRRAIDAVFVDIGKDEPGCAVGVIHEGEFIHKRGYGLANMEYGIPITSQTVKSDDPADAASLCRHG